MTYPAAPVANIISNPPYGIIQPWIERALSLASDKVAILARLALLEGQSRRDTLFAVHPPARVWVASRRPSMPPGGTGVKAAGGTIAYGWFVWDRAHVGRTELGWMGNGEWQPPVSARAAGVAVVQVGRE